MNNQMKMIFSAVIILLSFNLVAQDVINKKNGEVLKVVVKEINDSQIKYYHFDDPNQVLFTLDRAMIDEIKFSYGKEYVEKEPIMTEDYFVDDQNMALKLSMSSLLFSSIIVSFDRALSPTSGIQLTGKINNLNIGPAADNNNVESGFGLELGYRLKFGGLRKAKDEYRPLHLLAGGYVMPFIGFNTYAEKYKYHSNNSYERTSKMVSFGLNFGKQKVIQKLMVIDYYGGFAYYAGSFKNKFNGIDEDYSDQSISSGDLFGGNNVAVTFGLKVGLAFGKYGDQMKTKKSR